MLHNLLEPNLGRGIEDRDEWNGLLAGTLSDREEVSLVFSENELGCSCGILLYPCGWSREVKDREWRAVED